MPTNEFLPFAADPAANCMLQTDYAAAGFTARVLGFQTGTAISLQLNKVWRQASLIAAMIGAFSVSQSGFDMLDDGTPAGMAALQAHFTQAVRQVGSSGISTAYLPLAGGTITGPLTINSAPWQIAINAPAGQGAYVWLSRPAAQNALLQVNTSNVARWNLILASNEPESGGNAGSNIVINRFADNGAYLDSPFTLNRATGRLDLTQTPTVRGGPLPYMPLSGGSFTGPLYVPSPGIAYGGTEGHYIAFGWNGANIIGRVDGTATPGPLANQNFVNSQLAGYLPLGGGTITGGLAVQKSFNVYSTAGFSSTVWLAGFTDFAIFQGGGYRYFQWAGSWYDAWDGNTGRRYWVTYDGRSMQLDGAANLSVTGMFFSYAGRVVSQGVTPTLALHWPGLAAVGFWLAADSNLYVGTMDGGGNPINGRNRFGYDGVFTNWDGIQALAWVWAGQWLSVEQWIVANGQIVSHAYGAALRVESAYPCVLAWDTTANIGGGMRVDRYGIIMGQGDAQGTHNNLSSLRWDGWFFVSGNIGTPSDAAFKSAIRPSRQFDSLGALLGLDSIAFDWAESGLHQPFGLLASAVRERLPDVVVEDRGHDYVDQTSLLVHVIRALQQLAHRIGDATR